MNDGIKAGGIGGGGALGADIAEGNGLDTAAGVAGDALRGVFGGLPWELSASEIVDAAVPGGAEGASNAGAILVDAAWVLL